MSKPLLWLFVSCAGTFWLLKAGMWLVPGFSAEDLHAIDVLVAAYTAGAFLTFAYRESH